MAHSVDVHVGMRVRQRRWLLGLTQKQLGDLVGIKCQQISKYEAGENRVSASRLWDIAATLEVPIEFFFDGMNGQGADTGETQNDIYTDKEVGGLVRVYYAIPEKQRRRLFDLARVLSEAA